MNSMSESEIKALCFSLHNLTTVHCESPVLIKLDKRRCQQCLEKKVRLVSVCVRCKIEITQMCKRCALRGNRDNPERLADVPLHRVEQCVEQLQRKALKRRRQKTIPKDSQSVVQNKNSKTLKTSKSSSEIGISHVKTKVSASIKSELSFTDTELSLALDSSLKLHSVLVDSNSQSDGNKTNDSSVQLQTMQIDVKSLSNEEKRTDSKTQLQPMQVDAKSQNNGNKNIDLKSTLQPRQGGIKSQNNGEMRTDAKAQLQWPHQADAEFQSKEGKKTDSKGPLQQPKQVDAISQSNEDKIADSKAKLKQPKQVDAEFQSKVDKKADSKAKLKQAEQVDAESQSNEDKNTDSKGPLQQPKQVDAEFQSKEGKKTDSKAQLQKSKQVDAELQSKVDKRTDSKDHLQTLQYDTQFQRNGDKRTDSKAQLHPVLADYISKPSKHSSLQHATSDHLSSVMINSFRNNNLDRHNTKETTNVCTQQASNMGPGNDLVSMDLFITKELSALSFEKNIEQCQADKKLTLDQVFLTNQYPVEHRDGANVNERLCGIKTTKIQFSDNSSERDTSNPSTKSNSCTGQSFQGCSSPNNSSIQPEHSNDNDLSLEQPPGLVNSNQNGVVNVNNQSMNDVSTTTEQTSKQVIQKESYCYAQHSTVLGSLEHLQPCIFSHHTEGGLTMHRNQLANGQEQLSYNPLMSTEPLTCNTLWTNEQLTCNSQMSNEQLDCNPMRTNEQLTCNTQMSTEHSTSNPMSTNEQLTCYTQMSNELLTCNSLRTNEQLTCHTQMSNEQLICNPLRTNEQLTCNTQMSNEQLTCNGMMTSSQWTGNSTMTNGPPVFDPWLQRQSFFNTQTSSFQNHSPNNFSNNLAQPYNPVLQINSQLPFSNATTTNGLSLNGNYYVNSQPVFNNQFNGNHSPSNQPVFNNQFNNNHSPISQPVFNNQFNDNHTPISQPVFNNQFNDNHSPINQPVFNNQFNDHHSIVTQPVLSIPPTENHSFSTNNYRQSGHIFNNPAPNLQMTFQNMINQTDFSTHHPHNSHALADTQYNTSNVNFKPGTNDISILSSPSGSSQTLLNSPFEPQLPSFYNEAHSAQTFHANQNANCSFNCIVNPSFNNGLASNQSAFHSLASSNQLIPNLQYSFDNSNLNMQPFPNVQSSFDNSILNIGQCHNREYCLNSPRLNNRQLPNSFNSLNNDSLNLQPFTNHQNAFDNSNFNPHPCLYNQTVSQPHVFNNRVVNDESVNCPTSFNIHNTNNQNFCSHPVANNQLDFRVLNPNNQPLLSELTNSGQFLLNSSMTNSPITAVNIAPDNQPILQGPTMNSQSVFSDCFTNNQPVLNNLVANHQSAFNSSLKSNQNALLTQNQPVLNDTVASNQNSNCRLFDSSLSVNERALNNPPYLGQVSAISLSISTTESDQCLLTSPDILIQSNLSTQAAKDQHFLNNQVPETFETSTANEFRGEDIGDFCNKEKHNRNPIAPTSSSAPTLNQSDVSHPTIFTNQTSNEQVNKTQTEKPYSVLFNSIASNQSIINNEYTSHQPQMTTDQIANGQSVYNTQTVNQYGVGNHMVINELNVCNVSEKVQFCDATFNNKSLCPNVDSHNQTDNLHSFCSDSNFSKQNVLNIMSRNELNCFTNHGQSPQSHLCSQGLTEQSLFRNSQSSTLLHNSKVENTGIMCNSDRNEKQLYNTSLVESQGSTIDSQSSQEPACHSSFNPLSEQHLYTTQTPAEPLNYGVHVSTNLSSSYNLGHDMIQSIILSSDNQCPLSYHPTVDTTLSSKEIHTKHSFFSSKASTGKSDLDSNITFEPIVSPKGKDSMINSSHSENNNKNAKSTEVAVQQRENPLHITSHTTSKEKQLSHSLDEIPESITFDFNLLPVLNLGRCCSAPPYFTDDILEKSINGISQEIQEKVTVTTNPTEEVKDSCYSTDINTLVFSEITKPTDMVERSLPNHSPDLCQLLRESNEVLNGQQLKDALNLNSSLPSSPLLQPNENSTLLILTEEIHHKDQSNTQKEYSESNTMDRASTPTTRGDATIFTSNPHTDTTHDDTTILSSNPVTHTVECFPNQCTENNLQSPTCPRDENKGIAYSDQGVDNTHQNTMWKNISVRGKSSRMGVTASNNSFSSLTSCFSQNSGELRSRRKYRRFLKLKSPTCQRLEVRRHKKFQHQINEFFKMLMNPSKTLINNTDQSKQQFGKLLPLDIIHSRLTFFVEGWKEKCMSTLRKNYEKLLEDWRDTSIEGLKHQYDKLLEENSDTYLKRRFDQLLESRLRCALNSSPKSRRSNGEKPDDLTRFMAQNLFGADRRNLLQSQIHDRKQSNIDMNPAVGDPPPYSAILDEVLDESLRNPLEKGTAMQHSVFNVKNVRYENDQNKHVTTECDPSASGIKKYTPKTHSKCKPVKDVSQSENDFITASFQTAFVSNENCNEEMGGVMGTNLEQSELLFQDNTTSDNSYVNICYAKQSSPSIDAPYYSVRNSPSEDTSSVDEDRLFNHFGVGDHGTNFMQFNENLQLCAMDAYENDDDVRLLSVEACDFGPNQRVSQSGLFSVSKVEDSDGIGVEILYSRLNLNEESPVPEVMTVLSCNMKMYDQEINSLFDEINFSIGATKTSTVRSRN